MNADAIAGSLGELIGANIFAYCKNNPINHYDSTGYNTDGGGNDGEEIECGGFGSGGDNEADSVAGEGYTGYFPEDPVSSLQEIEDEIDAKIDISEEERANSNSDNQETKPKATKHAQYRKNNTKRPTGTVVNDIQNARPKDVLIEDNGNYIIRGNNGRVHVLSPDGSNHITTLFRTDANVNRLINQGRYSYSTYDEFQYIINLIE